MTFLKSHQFPWQIFAIFFLIVSGIGIAGFLYFQAQNEQVKQEKQNELAAIGDLKVSQIINWRNERLSDAKQIMANRPAARIVQTWLAAPTNASAKDDLRVWLNSYLNTITYSSVSLLDLQGNSLYLLPDAFTASGLYYREYIPQIIQQRQPYLTDLHTHEDTNTIDLDLLVPILNPQQADAPPIALVRLIIDPYQFLYPLIQSWPAPSQTAETLLVRRDGNDVLYLNELRHQKNTALILRLPMSTNALPAQQAVLGKQGVIEGTDYRHVLVLADLRTIPDSTWALVAKVDLDEIYAPLQQNGRAIAFVIGILILAAGAAFGFVWRQQRLEFFQTQFKSEHDKRVLAQRYEALMQNANDIVLLTDGTGHLIDFNQRAEHAYGYMLSELMELNLADLVAPNEPGSNNSDLSPASAPLYETVHRRKDGVTFPVEVSVSSVSIDNQTFIQRIVRDITERKKNQADQALNQERISTLLALTQMPEMSRNDFLDVVLDKSLALTQSQIGYIYYYDEATRLFTLNSWSKQAMHECAVVEKQTVYELDKTGLWGEAVRQRQPIIVNDFTAPNPLRQGYPAGHVALQRFLTIPLIIHDHIVAVAGVGNKASDYAPTDVQQLTLLIETAWNIAERQRAEHELRDSEYWLKTSQEIAQIGTYRFDIPAGTWSCTAVLDNILGIPSSYKKDVASWLALIHPDQQAEMLDYLQNHVLGQKLRFDKEYRIVRPSDGAARWVYGMGALTFDEHGAPITMIGTIQDIDARKQAEQEIYLLNTQLEQRVAQRTAQLETTNKELESFSYSVSHDLRAPLRALDGFSRIVQEEYAAQLPADAVRYLGIIRKNAQQMGRLIDDLLTFSRLGRQNLNKQPVDMNQLVAQTLETLQTAQETRAIEWSFGDLPACQGDAALLRQVWINLISNALKYTRQQNPTQIEIGARQEPGDTPRITYYVKDNGTGFDMRYADKLFGVFQRLHRAEDYEGTGVGLAIVQRILTRHSGRIWAEAQVNHGATFYFTVNDPERAPV